MRQQPCGPSLSIFLPKAENPNTGNLKLLLLQSSCPFTSNITLNNSVKPSSSSTITTNSSSMELQIYLLDFTSLHYSVYIYIAWKRKLNTFPFPIAELLLISRLMATSLIHFTELKSGCCRQGSFDFQKPRMLRKGVNWSVLLWSLLIRRYDHNYFYLLKTEYENHNCFSYDSSFHVTGYGAKRSRYFMKQSNLQVCWNPCVN